MIDLQSIPKSVKVIVILVIGYILVLLGGIDFKELDTLVNGIQTYTGALSAAEEVLNAR